MPKKYVLKSSQKRSLLPTSIGIDNLSTLLIKIIKIKEVIKKNGFYNFKEITNILFENVNGKQSYTDAIYMLKSAYNELIDLTDDEVINLFKIIFDKSIDNVSKSIVKLGNILKWSILLVNIYKTM